VPVFKTERYLAQCLDSVLGQTLDDIEVICSYTASPDESLNILRKYAENDSRLRIVYRNDGGLGGARNYGLNFASGKYVFFVDSDDWIVPNALEHLTEIAEQNCVDMVICAIQNFDESKQEFLTGTWCYDLSFPKKLNNKTFTYKDLKPEEIISVDAPVTAWNKLYRRAFLEENNLRFPEEIRYEDNPFYYEALLCAACICFTRERCYVYRVNRPGSLQATPANDGSLIDIVPIMKMLQDLLVAHNCSEQLRKTLLLYMCGEFAWRYQAMRGNKRRLLQAIKKTFSDFEYQEFLKALYLRGISKNDPILLMDSLKSVKVSVVIPAYNDEVFVAECVNSALSQTMTDIEVICVDDCSTDETAQVIAEIQERDSRIVLLRNEENRGPGYSRGKALEAANGEYIFFLDADDLLAESGALEQLYNACMKNGVLTAGGNLKHFYNNDTSNVGDYDGQQFNASGMFAYKYYLEQPSWGFSRFLYNFEVILENEIRFPDSRYYEDPLFFVRYMSVVREFYAIDAVVYLYRQSGKLWSLSLDNIVNLCPNIKEALKLLKDVDLGLYYKEYLSFIWFAGGIYEFMKKHPESRQFILDLTEDVFESVDFSSSAGYLTEGEKFHSFSEFMEICFEPTVFSVKKTYLQSKNSESETQETDKPLLRFALFSVGMLTKITPYPLKSKLFAVTIYMKKNGLKATAIKIMQKIMRRRI
jgi:glycosyltransferase involved in cell wall biosynthesis